MRALARLQCPVGRLQREGVDGERLRRRQAWVETRPSALPSLGRLINPYAEVIFNTAESRQ
jgi:sigma54-dependent transcription regulator